MTHWQRLLLATGLGLLAALASTSGRAASDAAHELERQRLDQVVRELDAVARVEAAFAAAREVMQEGPVRVKLADQAVLALPRGFVFVPSAEAAALLRVWDSRPGPDLLGMVLPGSGLGGRWFVVLHYHPTGFVRDDEARRWDAGVLLAALQEGVRARAASAGSVAASAPSVSWIEPPRYDAQARQLVWALAAAPGAGARQSANVHGFSLGREGYVSMNLVADAADVARHRPALEALLAALSFRDGKRYDDFNPATDTVAAHGLTALIGEAPAPRRAPPAAPPRPGGLEPSAAWASAGLGAAAALGLAGAGLWWARRRARRRAATFSTLEALDPLVPYRRAGPAEPLRAASAPAMPVVDVEDDPACRSAVFETDAPRLHHPRQETRP